MIEDLEKRLDSFDATERKNALNALCEQVATGQITLPEPGSYINMHCHTFFSYNCYGYSPSKLAWLSRKEGLVAAGIVDFDVLDGLEEFLKAGRMLGLKTCGGLESRVFVPEFADKVINSPGEPGISYHMVVGFASTNLKDEQQNFLKKLRELAQQRNRELTERVNKYLKPIVLDYNKDVLTLTPSCNATERHICLAYARKAAEYFKDNNTLEKYWAGKLDIESGSLELPESVPLLNTIRKKTMKQGGVGYVLPDKGSFPLLSDTNRFALASGAIPTVTWLDGTSEGEKHIEGLLDVAMGSGAAALNIIPDRNYTPGRKDQKLQNLYDVVQLAEKKNLPIVVGTEMNSPGQKFVDAFDTAELSPLLPVFLKGAYILYAHSVLQRQAGIGYTSEWAAENFDSVEDKNQFFQQVGEMLQPQQEDSLSSLPADATPQQIPEKLKSS